MALLNYFGGPQIVNYNRNVVYFQPVPTHVWVTLIKERLEKEDCISKVNYGFKITR